MDDDVLLSRVGAARGAVCRADLRLSRNQRRYLERLVESGRLRLHPYGIVAVPNADRRVLVARIHRGLITCEHAAAYYGLPLLGAPREIHVLAPRGSRIPPVAGERVHEVRGRSTLPLSAFPVVSVERCVADLLCCGDEWTSLVVADAALHRGTTREQVLAHLRGPRRARGRLRLGRASGRARSPLETLARIQLRAAGLDVADGVVIAGVGEVDLVVDGWLVVELDGFTFHSDPWTFDQDRRRDRELVRRGYTVVRFTSNDVRSGKIVTEVRRIIAARPETGGPRPA